MVSQSATTAQPHMLCTALHVLGAAVLPMHAACMSWIRTSFILACTDSFVTAAHPLTSTAGCWDEPDTRIGSMAPCGSTLRRPARRRVTSGTPSTKSTWPCTGSRSPQNASCTPAGSCTVSAQELCRLSGRLSCCWPTPLEHGQRRAEQCFVATTSCCHKTRGSSTGHTLAWLALGGGQQEVRPLRPDSPRGLQVHQDGRRLRAQAAMLQCSISGTHDVCDPGKCAAPVHVHAAYKVTVSALAHKPAR